MRSMRRALLSSTSGQWSWRSASCVHGSNLATAAPFQALNAAMSNLSSSTVLTISITFVFVAINSSAYSGQPRLTLTCDLCKCFTTILTFQCRSHYCSGALFCTPSCRHCAVWTGRIFSHFVNVFLFSSPLSPLLSRFTPVSSCLVLTIIVELLRQHDNQSIQQQVTKDLKSGAVS